MMETVRLHLLSAHTALALMRARAEALGMDEAVLAVLWLHADAHIGQAVREIDAAMGEDLMAIYESGAGAPSVSDLEKLVR